MAVDQKFVFSDQIALRCKFVGDEYIPVEILDLEDLIRMIKELLVSKMAFRRRTSDEASPRKDSSTSLMTASIKNRILQSRRTSTPEYFKSKSTEQISPIESPTNSVILRMSPMMKQRRYSEKRYSTGQLRDDVFQSNIDETPSSSCEDLDNVNMIPCLKDNPSDYVHIATFNKLTDTEKFLSLILESRKTVAIEFNVSETSQISISYQQLQNFNQEFMMLSMKTSEHMLFLRPF